MEINESLILTKTSLGELSPSLTSQEAKIVLASQGLKIKDLKKREVANKVTDLFGASLVVMNHPNKIGKEDRVAMEQVIVSDIYEKFQFLTLKEVENAFWMGSRGQLKNKPEEIVYMSIAQVYQWLTNYRVLIKRDAMKKQIDFEAKKESEEIEKKKEEMGRLMKETIIQSFKDFQEGKGVNDPVCAMYYWLDNRGYIKLSNARKKTIYDQCWNEYKAKHEKGKSIADYAMNKKILADMENGLSYIQSRIKVLSKQKALLVTFGDIQESGLTIEEYINETI